MTLVWVFIVITASTVFGQRKALLLEHRDRIRIKAVPILNSDFRETNLCITPDGRYLYFMSLRGGQPWSNSFLEFEGRKVFDGDVWFSEKVNGKWQRPKCLPFGVNTSSGEDEPNISPDGTVVYYQSWEEFWAERGGPYYVVSFDRETGNWGRKKGMGGGIHGFFMANKLIRATDGMSVSPDGRKFVVACGQDYDGNMDVYLSTKGRLGWGYLKRLSISTDGDERSVFIAADGRTIYFASDGYEGYGGLDIYKTELNEDGTMGEVINLGEPFNTPADDYGFILSGDGAEGYFVRDGDIYFADLTHADPRIRPGTDLNLFGTVRDSLSGVGIPSKLVLLDAYTKRPVKRITTDARGNFSTTIDNEKRIYDLVIVESGSYPQKSKRLRTEKTAYADNYEVNFRLKRDKPIPLAKRNEVVPKVEPPAPKPKKKLPTIGGIDRPEGVDLNTGQGDVSDVDKVYNPYDFTGVASNNLILLIDVSASMKQSARLPLLKDAFLRMTVNMRKDDQVTVLGYNDNVEIIAEAVPATQTGVIDAAISSLTAGGGTRGKMALKLAYKLAEEHYISGGNNRIILATDGFFDLKEIEKEAKKYNKRVQLSVFSFGKVGPDRRKMFDDIAEVGGGKHTNITRNNIDESLLNEAKAVKK